MIRTIMLSLLLFVSSYSFCQTAGKNKSIFASAKEKDSNQENNFFFSLDEKGEKLVVPSDNNGFKLYGIKIFNSDSKELVSAVIDPALNPNYIDVSKLSAGHYIVHLVTVQQILYISKLAISR